MSENLTCNIVKEMLSAYFDDELSVEEKKAVEEHLKNCSDCNQELENIKRTSLIMKKSYRVSDRNISKQSSDEIFALLPPNITKCLQFKSNLSAFIDGELDKQDSIEILEHIINCEYCRKEYEKIKKTKKVTQNYLNNARCRDLFQFRQRAHIVILEKVREEKNKKRIFSSAAALMFISGLVWFSAVNFTPKATPSEDINIDHTKFIRSERPLYVNNYIQVEEWILTELDKQPPEEMVSVLYGE